jgi:hypothetical protein
MESPMTSDTRTTKGAALPPQNRGERAIAAGQGAFYLVTGVWPLISMRTFESVTGPKVDKWLVKTVGVLVAAIGASLLLSARRRRIAPEMRFLALASAAGLAAIDVTYVVKGRIAPVYLLDALTELALIEMWRASRFEVRGSRSPSSPTALVR